VSFETFHDFLYMGGHYAFVWSAYGIGAVGIAFILMRPLLARRRFFAEHAQRLRRQSPTANGEHDASHSA
jgi:heme exporter protein D